jgi:hypothetical protein
MSSLVFLVVCGCGREGPVSLRKFPYPYRAGVAISSDIDETWTREEFLEIQRYLCTRDSTGMGPGLGLEVGNSFWFYDWTDRSDFTYFENRTARPSLQASLIDSLVRSGYIDVLHSYGDFSEGGFRRELAAPCVAVLERWRSEGIPIRTWVNHGNPLNRQALGQLPYQRGDDPGSAEYHTDLLRDTGLEYAGMWEVTHVIGQETRHRVGDLLKDGAAALIYGLNRIRGRPQTHFRFRNDLMRVATLDDGNRVYSFRRFISPGRFRGADVWNLPEQIAPDVLEELKSRQGYMILYTHLGGNDGLDEYIPDDARRALRVLANEHDSGGIFVTMTTRLLDYCRMQKGLRWRSIAEGDSITVFVTGVDDPLGRWDDAREEFLQGMTFYVPNARRAAILLHGKVLPVRRNPEDSTGRESVTIPWERRTFPDVE